MRPALLLALTLLTACGNVMREEPAVEVAAEPVVVELEPSAIAPTTDCQPGDDDGIGGTGCQVD